jgi:hypothetical protein
MLHAYVLAWSGDTPGLAKLMCTTGHNSYMGCRFCEIKGTLCRVNKHVYFPLGTFNQDHIIHDPYNLPYRQHESYLKIFRLLNNAQNASHHKALSKQYGLYQCNY